MEGLLPSLLTMGLNGFENALSNSLIEFTTNVPRAMYIQSENMCIAKPTCKLDKNDFKAKKIPENASEKPCKFFVSAFKFDTQLGSRGANQLMEKLIECPN